MSITDATPGSDDPFEAPAPAETAPVGDLSGILIEAKRAIEAIVMVADEPADPRMLAQLIEISANQVDEICSQIAAELDEQRRGFELVKVAGGWRFQSRGELSPYVERFVLAGQSARLSAAALETLSIVAYKQPISRAQVAAIRGVSVDGVMRTLQQRGYIGELARDPGPGQAILFGTTSLFLERMGLNSLDELPALGDFVPGPEVIEALEAGLRVVDNEPMLPADAALPDAEAATHVGEVGAEAEADTDGDAGGDAEDADLVAVVDLRDGIDLTVAQPVDLTEPLALDALDVLSDEPTS